jgi:signal transduction histidine kinase
MSEALRAAAEHDARIDAQRRFLISATAHDLRTPLFALRGYLEAIATGVGPAEQQLDKARTKATQLERLVASLFAHARAELGEPARLITVDLTAAVHDAAYGYERIRITGRPVPAVIDPDRFERVVANVLDNALRHSPPGATVDVTVDLDASAAVVRIADRGPSIPVDLLPRIFEPMVYADRPHPRGAGLGLAIAAHLLESQTGTISAENRVDGGAVFTIRLPSPDSASAPANSQRTPC